MHNHEAIILGVERDVKKAAELGMALLSRHETFVAEAKAEQAKMTGMLESMEHENMSLERDNQMLIKRNRDLFEELEQLNEALITSEENSAVLSSDLGAMNIEITRLNILTSRCEQLEDQLSILDVERGGLQKALTSSQKHEADLIKKWDASENALHDMSGRVWVIDGENKEEKIRKGNLYAKLLRTKEEKIKLDSLLQKMVEANAALESSENELREMLASAHEEIKLLHEEMLGRQNPLEVSSELKKPRKTLSQELHVHHHYHRAQRKRSKMLAARKSPKTPTFQEQFLKAGLPTPPSSIHLSATELDFEHARDKGLTKLRRSLSDVDDTPSRQLSSHEPPPSSPPDSPRPRRTKSFILPSSSPLVVKLVNEDTQDSSVYTPVAALSKGPRKSASHESILTPSQLRFAPKFRAQACFVSSPTMGTSSTEFSFTEASAMHHTHGVSSSLSQQLLTVANGKPKVSRADPPKRGWTFWKSWSAADTPQEVIAKDSNASHKPARKYKEPNELLHGMVNQSLLAESLG